MSDTQKVDCRGLACPQPVINTKKALEAIRQGTVITVVDNDIAKENVTLFARNSGHHVIAEKIGDNYHITINKGPAGEIKEEFLPIKGNKETSSAVYLITSDQLGQGSPDLGQVLMKSLMVTLVESNPLPQAVLFLNTGVMLTCIGSPVLEQLHSLANKGVVLISCGTCLEYYKLKQKLEIGRVGSMLDINNYMSESTKVITIG